MFNSLQRLRQPDDRFFHSCVKIEEQDGYMSNKLDDHEIGNINLIAGRGSVIGCQIPKLHLGFLNSFSGKAYIYLVGLSTESHGSVLFF